MDKAIKDCPFCGGEAQLMIAPYNRAIEIPCVGVYCKQCKVMIGTVAHEKTDFFRTTEEALRAWNRRKES